MLAWISVRRARWLSLGVLSAFALGAALATARLPAWVDEGYSLATSNASPRVAALRSLTVELQPPLYFVLLSIWRTLGDSLVVARLLSVVIGVLAALSVAGAVRAGDPERPPWVEPLALAFVVTNPFTFSYSAEARSYALQVLFGGLTALVSCRVVQRGQASPRQVLALGAVAVLALYTHYYAALTACVAAGVLWLTRRLTFRQLSAVAGSVVVGALPLLAYAGSHAQHVNSEQRLVPGQSAAMLLSGLVLNAVPTLTRHLSLQVAWVVALGVAVVVVGRRASAVPKPLPAAKHLGATLGIALLVLFAVGMVAGPSALFQRYLASLYPLAWTAIVLTLGAVLGWARAGAVLSVVIALASFRTFKIQATAHKSGDWGPMTQSLAARPGPSRVLYVYPLEETLPARIGLSPPFRVIGLPRDFDGTRLLTAADFELGTPAELARYVERSSGKGPFWLSVATPPLVPGFAHGDLPGIERFVTSCCTMHEEREFVDAMVVLLTLRDECLR